MFDVGFLELVFICVIGLVVLGPERMPHAVKWVGRALGKLRRMVGDLSKQVNTQLELEELRESIREQKEDLDVSKEMAEIKSKVSEASNDLRRDLNPVNKNDELSDIHVEGVSVRKAVNE